MKKKTVVLPTYQERIYNYNKEKQTAMLGCETQEQAERVIAYLRKKWKV